MTKFSSSFLSRTLFWLVTSTFLAGSLSLLYVPLSRVHSSLQNQNSDLAWQVARLENMKTRLPALTRKLEITRAALSQSPQRVQAGSADMAAARFQELARRAIEEQNGEVVSTQLVKQITVEPLDLVTVRVTFRASAHTLAEVLAALEAVSPAFLIERAQIRSTREGFGDGAGQTERLLFTLDMTGAWHDQAVTAEP